MHCDGGSRDQQVHRLGLQALRIEWVRAAEVGSLLLYPLNRKLGSAAGRSNYGTKLSHVRTLERVVTGSKQCRLSLFMHDRIELHELGIISLEISKPQKWPHHCRRDPPPTPEVKPAALQITPKQELGSIGRGTHLNET